MNVYPGILLQSSNVIYGFNKRGIPRKRFIPLDKNVGPLIVSCKKKINYDIYVTVQHQDRNTDVGVLQEIIGAVGDHEVELKFLEYRYGIRYKPLKYLDKNIAHVERIDFTNKEIISIDPVGCQDVDDALHVEKVDDTYTVGVHIADVSAWVEHGSEIDLKVRERAETVYLANKRIDMLPSDMATGSCSLLENQLRNAVTILFTIDENGMIQDVSHHKSRIINKHQLTYENAEERVNEEPIKTLLKVAQLLDGGENRIDMHRLVEIFMVEANRYVAKHVNLFRCCSSSQFLKEDTKGKQLANILKENSAEYSMESRPHRPLGLERYTHFTSPIRRYADIIVHRMLFNLDVPDLKEIVDHLNRKQRIIKQAERDSILLEIVHKIDGLIEGSGEIISIDDNILTLYIEQYGIIHTCKLFSNKIKHIVEYESDEKFIRIGGTELNLFDKIDIRLIVKRKAFWIKKKLIIQTDTKKSNISDHSPL